MAMKPAGGAVRFSQEAWAELRKVTWPSRETVARLTAIVIIISALVSIYIYAFDVLFTNVITQGYLGAPQPSAVPVAPVAP